MINAPGDGEESEKGEDTENRELGKFPVPRMAIQLRDFSLL